MDVTTTSNKKLINIISNVVVLPLENTQDTSETIEKSCTLATTQTQDVDIVASEIIDISDEPEEESTMFKNLFFELPNLKRNNDSKEGPSQKKSKLEGEEDLKIFNYVTGTYEVVRRDLRAQEDIKEEPILIEEHDLCQEVQSSTQDLEINEMDENWVVVVKGLSGDHKEALSNIIPSNNILEGTKIIDNSVLASHILTDDEKVQPNNNLIRLLLNQKSSLDCPKLFREEEVKYEGTKIIDNSILTLPDEEKGQSNNILKLLLKDPPLNYPKEEVNNTSLVFHVNSSATPIISTSNETEQTYKCQSCPYTSKIKGDLISHIYNEHLKDDYVLTLKCKHCQFETKTESKLKQHERTHNKLDRGSDSSDPDYIANTSENSSDDSYDSDESPELNKAGQYVCFKCGYTTKYSRYYWRHKKKWGGCKQRNSVENSSVTVILEHQQENVSKVPSVKKIITVMCFDCKYFFRTNEQLKRHVAVEHSGKVFTCDLHPFNDQASVCSKCNYGVILKAIQEQIKSKSQDVICLSDTNEDTGLAKNSILRDQNQKLLAPLISMQIKCFDCNLVFPTNEELRQHTVLLHSMSSFKCDLHLTNDKFSECSKCNYVMILRVLQTLSKRVKNNSLDVTCLNDENSDSNDNTKKYNQNNSEAFDMQISRMKLRTVQRQSEPQEVICLSDTEDSVDNNKKLLGNNGLVNDSAIILYNLLSKKSENCEIANNSPRNNTSVIVDDDDSNQFANSTDELQCFDCSYSTCDPIKFRTHVVKHIDSEFCCKNHLECIEKKCPKCYYEHILVVNRNNSQDADGDGQGDLQCYCCNFKTDKRRLLKYHCMQHYDVNFKCDYHDVLTGDCKKCTFEDVLKYTKKHLYVCKNCNFKSFLYYCFELHNNDCKTPNAYKCFDCNVTKFPNLSDLRQHVLKHHLFSSFVCERHGTRQDQDPSCRECFYQKMVKDILGNNYTQLACWHCNGKLYSRINMLKDHIQTNHSNSVYVCTEHAADKVNHCSKCNYEKTICTLRKSFNITFKCFDCEFSSVHFGNFKSHVKNRHPVSKFKCEKHEDEHLVSCEQCNYSIFVSDAPNRFIQCFKCAVPKVISLDGLKRHILTLHKNNYLFTCPQHPMGGSNCSMCWFDSYTRRIVFYKYNCFDCSYNTSQLAGLRKHIKTAHEFSKFKCKKHITDNVSSNCPSCIYATSVVEVRNWRCFACPSAQSFFELRYLKEHIYKEHNKSVFVCPNHGSTSDVCGMCYFGTLVKNMFKFCCYDCNIKTLHNKQALINHVKEKHGKSKFTCNLHPLVPEVGSCSRCDYEALAQQIAVNNNNDNVPQKATTNKILSTYKCFDCIHTEVDVDFLKDHIRKKHEDSTFMCTKHNLGEIDNTCEQCVYENLVLLMKET